MWSRKYSSETPPEAGKTRPWSTSYVSACYDPSSSSSMPFFYLFFIFIHRLSKDTVVPKHWKICSFSLAVCLIFKFKLKKL